MLALWLAGAAPEDPPQPPKTPIHVTLGGGANVGVFQPQSSYPFESPAKHAVGPFVTLGVSRGSLFANVEGGFAATPSKSTRLLGVVGASFAMSTRYTLAVETGYELARSHLVITPLPLSLAGDAYARRMMLNLGVERGLGKTLVVRIGPEIAFVVAQTSLVVDTGQARASDVIARDQLSELGLSIRGRFATKRFRSELGSAFLRTAHASLLARSLIRIRGRAAFSCARHMSCFAAFGLSTGSRSPAETLRNMGGFGVVFEK
jgi:hypothetical protein